VDRDLEISVILDCGWLPPETLLETLDALERVGSTISLRQRLTELGLLTNQQRGDLERLLAGFTPTEAAVKPISGAILETGRHKSLAESGVVGNKQPMVGAAESRNMPGFMAAAQDDVNTLMLAAPPAMLAHLRQLGEKRSRAALDQTQSEERVAELPTEEPDLTGRSFGRFKVKERLSAGSVGVVYKALKGSELVALKVSYKRDMTDLDRERFEREAKVLSQLSHRNIVRVLDYGIEQGRCFIAMEFVQGQSLEAVVEEHRRRHKELPDPQWMARVLGDVAHALAYLHGRGLVHRDVKPANIMVESLTGRPVLIDFGLVGRNPEQSQVQVMGLTKSLTQSGMVQGTPFFMGPEQVFQDGGYGVLGAASDVWALGATLFFTLTGEPPFISDSLTELFRALRDGRLRRVRELSPEIPEWLDDLCADCLQRQTAERLTMAAVVQRLQLRGEKAASVASFGASLPSPQALVGVAVVCTVLGLVLGTLLVFLLELALR